MTPMGLLWRFMEYSPVYSTIAGIMEMTVVVLLCFRRTATLGALIAIPVMLNVMLMNLCYDVVVKLFSTAMVVSAVVLLLYDARRLIDLLVLHRAVPARPVAPPFRSPRLNRARWVVKLVVVGGVLLSSAAVMHDRRSQIDADEASPLFGAWEVTSFMVNGRELAQTADPSRWRRVVMSRGRLALRLEDERLVSCSATPGEATGDATRAATQTLAIGCPKTGQDGSLRWTRDADELRLEGSFDRAPVTAKLKRRDEAGLPLLRTRFQWTFDG
jgi:hypothetical protein